MQAEIIQFAMKPHKTIRESWGRFKSPVKRCPNHGSNAGHQAITFYRGCIPDAMHELNMSAGGVLLHLGEDKTLQLIESVASNDEGWNNERNKSYRVASTSDNNQVGSLTQRIELLNKKVEPMSMENQGTELQGRRGIESVNYVHQGKQQNIQQLPLQPRG